MQRPRLVTGAVTALLLAGGASISGCHDSNAPTGAPGSMVVIRQDAPTDTVNAPSAILVLRIFDGAGNPAARTMIDFRAPILSSGGYNWIALWIAPDTSRPGDEGYLRTVSTDDEGRVAIAVRRGPLAGRLAVGVTSAFIQQLRDSVIYVTTPAPLAVIAPTPATARPRLGANMP